MKRLKAIELKRSEVTHQPSMHIEEVKIREFARAHCLRFQSSPDSMWNGRQIRNAFQIATSLARYEHSCNPHRGLFLSSQHFEQVEEVTHQYYQIRQGALGATDAELAHRKSDRDRERNSLSEQRPSTILQPGHPWSHPGGGREGTSTASRGPLSSHHQFGVFTPSTGGFQASSRFSDQPVFNTAGSHQEMALRQPLSPQPPHSSTLSSSYAGSMPSLSPYSPSRAVSELGVFGPQDENGTPTIRQ